MQKILYVDDDQNQIDAFTRYINKARFDVLSETDPTKAIGRIRSERPDLVILDIIMNDVSGVELLQQIRADAAIREIPVVFLTNLAAEEVAHDANRLGAVAVWEKTRTAPQAVAAKSDSYLRKAVSQPKRVLIIDDDPVLTEQYDKRLSLTGFQVTVEHAPEHALQSAIETRPDLILLDIVMAGMDGAEVLRQLKADPRTRAIPVVVLSGAVDLPESLGIRGRGGYIDMWDKSNLVPSTLALKVGELLHV